MKSVSRPFVLNPGEGKEMSVGSSRLFLKLSAGAVSNRLSMTEYELSPQFPGPPPHKHRVFEHAWYVLEGELSVQLEHNTFVLTKGGFVFIPRQTAHAFSNKTDTVVKVLVMDTPGGFESYYDDLQAAFAKGRPIDQEEMRTIQLKYDTYPPDHVF